VTGPFSRPFRFSVQSSSPPHGTDGQAWAALARKVEDLGYSTLTVADHLDDQLAPVPALMAAADATTTLRVGAMVFCNDYKHPVVLAKEAATLDVLSGGRFELGLGAGWQTSDYEAAGIAFDRHGVRIDRLEEAVTLIKALLSDDPATFVGDHYRVTDLDAQPKPTQRPHPPILIGGGGKRVLSLAGREADIVGVNVSLPRGVIDATCGPDATVEHTDEKIQWIRDAAGDRWDGLELHVRIHVALVSDDRMSVADVLGPALGLTPTAALASPHALCGTVDEIVDDLVERRERWGLSAIGLSLDALDSFAPVVARLANT
jgi:probable F420-dependent oxidoreductase